MFREAGRARLGVHVAEGFHVVAHAHLDVHGIEVFHEVGHGHLVGRVREEIHVHKDEAGVVSAVSVYALTVFVH